jgi:hypothetical protein
MEPRNSKSDCPLHATTIVMTAYRGGQSTGVLIGIDPHKCVNAAAIDEQGELAGHETFPANRKGLRALERWAKRFPERRWAVEGAAGIGRPVAQRLAMAGEKVEEPPCRTSGWPQYDPRTATTLTSRFWPHRGVAHSHSPGYSQRGRYTLRSSDFRCTEFCEVLTGCDMFRKCYPCTREIGETSQPLWARDREPLSVDAF